MNLLVHSYHVPYVGQPNEASLEIRPTAIECGIDTAEILTVLEPRNQSIDEFYGVQERHATDSEALKF